MLATPPPVTSNAQRRALILSRVEARLKEIWPDSLPAGQRTLADFDALEATATRSGDALARTLMEEGLSEALKLSKEERPEHCEKCGRKLQWGRREHGLQTIRGPVKVERDYGYCRACERGFFPRGGELSPGRRTPERALAASLERVGQRR